MDRLDRVRFAATSIRWADQSVLFALCVAEAALLWLCATAVLAVPAGVPDAIDPWLAFGLLWGTALLPRTLEALDVWDPWHRVAMGLGVLATVAISVHVISFPDMPWLSTDWIREAFSSVILRPSLADVSVWCAIALVSAVWWRSYVRDEPTRDSAFRLMRVGSIGMLTGAVILAVTDRATGEVESSAAVLIFFVAGLAAIGLASLTSGDNAGRAEPSVRSVVVSFAPMFLAVAFAVMLSGVLRRDLLDTIVWALAPLLWGVSVIVRAIVISVALVAVVIMTPFLWLLEGHSFRLRPIRFDASDRGSTGIVERATGSANSIPDPIRYLIAAAVLCLVFTGVTRFVLRRRQRHARALRSEEHTRVRPLFDVSKALATLRRLLGIAGQEEFDDPLDELRGDRRWAATVHIRERYRDVLRWSVERDRGRRQGQTPSEHAAQLEASIAGPGARADVTTIAAIYSRTRYSPDPASSADADTMEAAWNRLTRASRNAR